jgi:Ni2+-binding GTPase involved in maturation of urease and hydrogenase
LLGIIPRLASLFHEQYARIFQKSFKWSKYLTEYYKESHKESSMLEGTTEGKSEGTVETTGKSTTQVILVTGFLGSGKTTFLHEDIKDTEDKKKVTMLNERGQFQVKSAGAFPDSYRLSMGSCLLKTINSLLAYRYDYIFVETSGLAQPSVLYQLVTNAAVRSSGRLRFRGMICVIDALRFLKLVSTVASLYEQVVYADCFVLSKSDLAEQKELEKIHQTLQVIRPQAPIFIRNRLPVSFSTLLSSIQEPLPIIYKPNSPGIRIPDILNPTLTCPKPMSIRTVQQYAS